MIEIKLPDILKEVEAPVVGNIECSDAYEGIITDSLMCAGFLDEGEKAPCEVKHQSFISSGTVYLKCMSFSIKLRD